MALDVFESVKAQADPVQILDALLGPRDRSKKWNCPFHPDKTPSLSEHGGTAWLPAVPMPTSMSSIAQFLIVDLPLI